MFKKYADYLEYLGMPLNSSVKDALCEVCGSDERKILRNEVRINEELSVELPVVVCSICGFIYQLPRFERDFYDQYYSKYYRSVTSGSIRPSKGFIDDQISRGRFLFNNLVDYLPSTGRLLDVGCSSGGLMFAFKEQGWDVFGVDPDKGYVDFGRSELGLNIICMSAEDMILNKSEFDLIIINGSLEHVFDPNTVLELCSSASKQDSLLLIEGRALAQAKQIKSCSHNHRRYLTKSSTELFMLKHGWQPLFSTHEDLCGSTRPDSIFTLAKFTLSSNTQNFKKVLSSYKADTVFDICDLFDLEGIR